MALGRLQLGLAAGLLLGAAGCARGPTTLTELRVRERPADYARRERLTREDALDDLSIALAALEHGSVLDALRPVPRKRLEGALVDGPALMEDRVAFCAELGDALAEGQALPLFATLDGTALCGRRAYEQRMRAEAFKGAGKNLAAGEGRPFTLRGQQAGEVVVPVLAISSFDPARDWSSYERFLLRAASERALVVDLRGAAGADVSRAFAAARVLGADCAADLGGAKQRQSDEARAARDRYAQRAEALHGEVDASASACASFLSTGRDSLAEWLEAPPPDEDRPRDAGRPQALSLVFDRGCAEACEVLVAALTCDVSVLTFGQPTFGSAELFATGLARLPRSGVEIFFPTAARQLGRAAGSSLYGIKPRYNAEDGKDALAAAVDQTAQLIMLGR